MKKLVDGDKLVGKAWVLERIKGKFSGGDKLVEYLRSELREWIADLESKAPVDKLVKQAKENERKAKMWDMAIRDNELGESVILSIEEDVDKELLAQSESGDPSGNPPEGKEKKR